jgi:hypothetical protein
MSSVPMGDAQPEAVAADHTLTTDKVDNSAEAGAAQPDEPLPGEPLPGGPLSGGPGPDPEAAAEPGTADTAAGPDADAEWEAEWGEDAGEPEPDESGEMYEPDEEPAPRRRRRWRGVVLAVVFLLAGAAIVGGAFAIVGSLTHGFKKPVIITYKKSAIFSLRTGECIDPNGQAASIVTCDTPHEAEVFATFALPAAKWPGTASVRASASSGCASQLTSYLNPQLAISLATTYVYPDKVAWRAGTRTVICEVRATKGELTGSVRGATAS